MRSQLTNQLAEARKRTDELFELIKPEALYERPIPERHRIIFYLGHLETFDWNMICRTSFGYEPFHPAFDQLFAFGIDPTDGNLPADKPGDWPAVDEIRKYVQRIRSTVDDCLRRAEDWLLFHVAIEHRFMHAETLAYMFHWLPYDLKNRPKAQSQTNDEPGNSKRIGSGSRVEIPRGRSELGLRQSAHHPFGWDNEFQPFSIEVPAFSIDVYNVTNGEYLRFIEESGAQTYPRFWANRNGRWFYRGMFEEIPLPLSWPVFVSHNDGSAYAHWVGRALPTEAQYHRAAFGTNGGTERPYPWGDSVPAAKHGNFDFRSWDPTPVGSCPDGNSAYGVADLMGNGWEWTSTPFAPFPGFQPFPFYPGYSADFFDNAHYVMKGASPRTAATLLRRSFRNWFQPQYPYIYATFRCVD